jgi:hypothetical protein
MEEVTEISKVVQKEQVSLIQIFKLMKIFKENPLEEIIIMLQN